MAIDAIVPIVHPNNKVPNISLDALRKIYKRRNQELERNRRRKCPNRIGLERYILWYLRNLGRIGHEETKNLSKSFCFSPPTVQSYKPSQKILMPSATSVSDTLLSSIKAVNVNGIKATSEAAADGKWPLSRELYLLHQRRSERCCRKSYFLHPLLRKAKN